MWGHNFGPIGSAVFTFIGYKRTGPQTNKQTSKVYYVYAERDLLQYGPEHKISFH